MRLGRPRPRPPFGRSPAGGEIPAGYATERDLRISKKGKFKKNKRFEITEKELPPEYFNDIYGKFLYPKKGKRKKPTVKGKFSAEFGYGLTRSTYNCLAAEEFTATRKG